MSEMSIPEAGRLAIQHHRAGDLAAAAAIYRQILAVDPANANAMRLLGLVSHQRGQNQAALELLTWAIQLSPDSSSCYTDYGKVLRVLGRFDEAVAAHHRAIEINPNDAVAWNSLAHTLIGLGRHDEAIQAWEQAVRLRPDECGFRSNLAGGLLDQGRLDEAIACLEGAIKLNPDFAPAYGNLLSALRYHPRTTPQSLLEQHLRFAKRLADPLSAAVEPHANSRDPDRPLRVGYVSPDFREHSVMHFFEPVLRHHDGASFELYCYSSSAVEDEVTARTRSLVREFRSILSLDDARAAELIRADRIDILLDLAGHTAGGRPFLFARKPAPIQVSYLGYPCTTGLSAMDYRLTDAAADPPGMTESFHTETLIRLPDTFLCYQPSPAAPPVAPLPADANGWITFGSFNHLPKMTDDVIAAWCGILQSVPGSRLVIKSLPLTSRGPAARIAAAYQQHGLGPDRVVLLGYVDKFGGHLAAYNQIDIALDTFPYNGTTTTCEAMWMGVPVVALAGNAHISRVGVSLLRSVGLSDLIAADVEGYVRLAVSLAGQPERLRELRGQLRSRMAVSPLLDAARFTAGLEAAYRLMWRSLCGQP